MIEPKEDGEQHSERDGEENICDVDIPKVNQPTPVRGREEGRAGRQILDLDLHHAPDVHEASKEDNRQGGPVVLYEGADVVVKQGALADGVGKVGNRED